MKGIVPQYRRGILTSLSRATSLTLTTFRVRYLSFRAWIWSVQKYTNILSLSDEIVHDLFLLPTFLYFPNFL